MGAAKKGGPAKHVDRILKHAYETLNLDPTDYNRLVIRKKDEVAGVLFVPYRLHGETVFVPQGNMAGHEIRGTRAEVGKTLLRMDIDPDNSERIKDAYSREWPAETTKGASTG